MQDLKDSGNRRTFGTGAVRDTNEDKGRFDLVCPFALTVLAKVLQKGCIKYGERNWEKGIDMSSYVDSAIRHLLKYLMGMDDEDHLAAALYNVHCLVSQRERIKLGLLPDSLNNLPRPLEGKPELVEAYLSGLLVAEPKKLPKFVPLDQKGCMAACRVMCFTKESGGMELTNKTCPAKRDTCGSDGCCNALNALANEHGLDLVELSKRG